MGFGEAVSTCFRKYGDFNGRARRSEYWFFQLFSILVMIGIFVVGGVAGAFNGDRQNSTGGLVIGLLFLVWLLAFFVPALAVAVRRFHDMGHSGWWYLISFVPYIGSFILIVWFCFKGTAGPNRFGPDPLGDPAEAFT